MYASGLYLSSSCLIVACEIINGIGVEDWLRWYMQCLAAHRALYLPLGRGLFLSKVCGVVGSPQSLTAIKVKLFRSSLPPPATSSAAAVVVVPACSSSPLSRLELWSRVLLLILLPLLRSSRPPCSAAATNICSSISRATALNDCFRRRIVCYGCRARKIEFLLEIGKES